VLGSVPNGRTGWWNPAGLPVWHGAVGLIRLSGGADGEVEGRPFLRFVLGFVQVADAAEAVGVAFAGFGQQDVGSSEVFLDARDTRSARDGDTVRSGITRATSGA